MNPRKAIGVCLAALCLGALSIVPTFCTQIGILNQPDFPKLGAPSQPEHLAELLSKAGYEPVMLSADDLADPKKLDAGAMPVVVLPYGPVFPAEALDNWRGYLHNGGGFLSTGGYTFDTPVWRVNGCWVTWEQLVASDPKYVTNGKFESSDGWTVEGDTSAAHFGPDPNLGGKPGLVLGYPYESSYRTGGKQATVTVKQTFAAPLPGQYEVHFMHYARWTAGPGTFSVVIRTLDANDTQIDEYAAISKEASPGDEYASAAVRLRGKPGGEESGDFDLHVENSRHFRHF